MQIQQIGVKAMDTKTAFCSIFLVTATLTSPLSAAGPMMGGGGGGGGMTGGGGGGMMNGGLTNIERLGKMMYHDMNFSRNKTQSCMTCHHPMAGFADPMNL